jgi:hypothetical protein
VTATATATRTGHARAQHLTAVREVAWSVMAEYGLVDQGWTFAWDSARRRAGATHFDLRGGGKITLARDIMAGWSLADCENTIRHEIAHALAGPRAGHGPRWALQCIALGIKPERCWEPSEAQPLPPPRYVGTCPAGHPHKTDRKPTRLASCAVCAPYRFSHDHLITWERNA